ncbi:DUF11 domain-containing protein [Couchioplanes azureus]|uniref:DUF11 domain-containing protein n=1 Tax=Couchioplanes caeruleus TaxID=56438 RepID=UPI0016702EF3|nr:DUF11 domain-containing protein [Couchioplanes caeruleus]GGQ82593.1 hypothetical protein GCM10010166_60960 [Couchioplanes caeruleus subsp. azureus]
MSLSLGRPRRRRIAAVTALVLVLGTAIAIRTQPRVLAAEVPVPGQIAFSRSAPPSSAGSPSPPTSEPEVTAALAAPPRPTHLARVVAVPPYQPADPFASASTAAEFEPAWSPDGNRIAYTCADGGTSGTAICVADGNGASARKVTDPPPRSFDGEPTWSPDGTRLAFTRSQWMIEVPSRTAIRTVPADGAEGDTAPVVDLDEVRASHPSWSPDGRRIAYQHVSYDSGAERWTARIVAVTPAGTGATDLTDGPDDTDPAWSPDGLRLAYVERATAGAGTLMVLDVAAGTSTPLVRPAGGEIEVEFAAEPAWSPDGRTILYTWWNSYDDSGDIRAVPAAGGENIPVATGPTDDRHPTWRPTADLHVTVGAAPLPLQFGQPGTIVTTVTNGGPAPARAARLTVQLPADLDAPAVEPATCDLDAGRVTCELGDLATGASVAVRVTGRPDTFGTVAVTATATSGTADLDPADNTVQGRFEVEGTDLAATAVAPVGPVLLGEIVAYTVTVQRVAGDGVTGASVEITLPDNVTFAGVDPGAGTACSPTPGAPLRCALPPLGVESDDSATVVVRATATALGERTGSAQVTSPTRDVNPANDTSAFTTRVVGAELAVAKQAPTSAAVGEEFGYLIGVRNGGERAISGATLVDELPDGVTVVAAESASADCTVTTSPATVVCSLPPLPGTEGVPATADLVQVRVRVRATAPGPVRNTACVRAVLPPEPAEPATPGAAPRRVFEDCDDVTTQVDAGDLAVGVTASAPVGYVGGRIRASVVVRNAGTATVPAAVRLRLPATACETPAAAGCAAASRDVSLGMLAPGAAVTVPVQLVPVARGPATVAAQVLPATFDLSDRNDRAQATVSIRQPTLVVEPPIGPPGFVTSVRGTEFPPAATVRLAWSRGLTLTRAAPVVVGSDGTFRTPMLVAGRDDALGPRQVVAVTSGLPPVKAGFLVVPATLDPPDFAVRN